MGGHLRENLDAGEILTLAERESGAYGLADAGLVARLTRLVDWINERGPYSPDQIWAMRDQFRAVLTNRLRIALDRQRYPAIAEEKIERPIFIIGFARSGTTMLHSLLAEDPAVLSPQSWHMHSPSPPPGMGPIANERIAHSRRRVEAWMDFCPSHKLTHPYVDKGAYGLIEDEELFSLDLHGAYPFHFYRVPTLEPGLVVPTENEVEVFRFHKQMLQHLQWNTGKTRWACKGPSAQMHLDALFEVYPDALCVWAHRPLGEIYASNVAIRAITYDAIRGYPGDWSSQARSHVEGMKAAFDRLIASDMIDDPRILHLSFREVARDPLAAVHKVYERYGEPVTPEFAARVKAWLADPENAADRFGRYPYSYEAFGLDRAWVEDLFGDYTQRFELA